MQLIPVEISATTARNDAHHISTPTAIDEVLLAVV